MKRIDDMTDQLEAIEKKYQKTEKAFDALVDDCARLDLFLRENKIPMPEMQLLRAYLQQYEDERTSINDEIKYSYSQLSNLKDDLKNGLYDETKREEYLISEENAVKTLNAKLDYFLDRFEKQSDFIISVEKQ